MKFLVVSDIHGSSDHAQKCVNLYYDLKVDRLLLLGDLLYHGPRNKISDDYNPAKVAEILNGIHDKVIAVRGNCDSEVDQMMLKFPILQESVFIINEGVNVFASHGHIYHPDKLPLMSENDVFIYGHVHVPIAKKENGKFILNPGSITFPKENNPNSYAVLDENGFIIYDLNNKIIKSIEF